MALTVASTILPPGNLTIRWSPTLSTLYLGMCGNSTSWPENTQSRADSQSDPVRDEQT